MNELSKKGIIEFVSIKNYGIKFTDEKTWRNFTSSKISKEEMLSRLEGIKTGYEVEVNYTEDKNFTNIQILNDSIATNTPQTQKNWKEGMVRFSDLLERFRKDYKNYSVRTGIIEFSMEKEYAVVKATISNGETILQDAFGDCTKENAQNSNTAKHFIRIAESRAIARAIRFLYGENAVDEEMSENINDSEKVE